jgi:putative acetyltransferase
MIIRNENEPDYEAISEITKEAFENHPYSDHTEQFIIKALRSSNALTISLVAVDAREVVGHIAFSPVTISDGSRDWYGLGPISVLPEMQRHGIGKSLMKEGLSRLKALGAKGCVLVGDPKYYRRLGFRNLPNVFVEGVPQVNTLALPFEEDKICGRVEFHKAFAAKG